MEWGKKWMLYLSLCMMIFLIACGTDNNSSTNGNGDYVTMEDTIGDTYKRDQEAAQVVSEKPYGTSDEALIRSESYKEIEENDYIQTSTENLSTFSIDVDTASYANIRDLIDENILPPKDAVRLEEMVNYFDYDYPQPQNGEAFKVYSATTNTPWNPDTLVTMIGIQGKDIDRDSLPPSNIVMLIDVSGSMQDYNKLPLLKASFGELLSNLTEEDTVSLVVYAGAAGVVLEGAKGNEMDVIMAALERLTAGGSTAGGDGIELAYSIGKKYFIENGNNRVILATDGDFNVGLSDVNALENYIEEKREEGIYLSVVGFGRGNTRDDIMESLADKGNGNYAYIDTLDEAKKVFGMEFKGTMFAIAKDVKVQVEFNPETVASYRLLGYENRMMSNEDFYDDSKDAGELGVGHEVTAIYELVLKNQNVNVNDHLYEVKLRYKEPNGIQSRGLDVASGGQNYMAYKDGNDDFLWALTVAEFAMLLRDSPYKSDASLERVLDTANLLADKAQNTYKDEFVKMVEAYASLLIKDAHEQ